MTTKNTKAETTSNVETPVRETRMVPLASLYLHPINPRRNICDEETEAMALSLETLGLMQNLLGLEEPQVGGGGQIGIVAGGRRWRGLQRMAENQGVDPATLMVPVKLASDEAEAKAWAGAENTARAALHPAAEIAAYARMIDGGGTIRLVAKAFAVSERHVQGRLKLAGLAEPVLAALKASEITLDQAAAIAICDDHARQAEVLDRLARWDQSPSEIRALLTRDATRMGEGLASFVTRDEYEAAGGSIREDLFGTDVFFENGTVLEQVAKAKLDAIATEVKCEGWRWVEVMPCVFDYETLSGFARTYPQQAEIPDAVATEYDDLAAAIDAGDASDEQISRFDEIEGALAAEHYSDVQRNIAGVCIGFDYNYAVRIERGLVAKSEKSAAITTGVLPPSHTPSKPERSGPYSAALATDLAAIRTGALQTALLDQPELALDLLAFTLHEGGGSAYPLGVKLDQGNSHPRVDDGYELDARLDKQDALHSVDPKAVARRFMAFRKRSRAERTALLTEAVARSLSGDLATDAKSSFFEQVAGLTAASVRTVWTPTDVGFFKRLTTAQLDALWCELLGKKTADNFYRKKADKVAFLHRLFNDPKCTGEYDQATQVRVAAWLPEGLLIAPVKAPRGKAKSSKTKTANTRKNEARVRATEAA